MKFAAYFTFGFIVVGGLGFFGTMIRSVVQREGWDAMTVFMCIFLAGIVLVAGCGIWATLKEK